MERDDRREKPLRFAVCGTGWWSQFQIPAWLELGGVELVAVTDRDAAKAESAAARYGVPRVYGDPEELMRSEELDFIDIITESPGHAPLVFLAAKHRIPVVCQKPMAPDYDTCRRMVAACDDAGVPFFINENYRWQPPIRALREALSEGLVGKPFRADIQLSTGGTDQLSNQPFLKTLRHYALLDMGSHVFDVARFLFGEVDTVYCETLRTVDWIEGDDVAVSLLRVGDVICTCEISDRLGTKVFVEGTGGSLELKPDHTIRIARSDGEEIRNCATWQHHDWIGREDEELLGGDCVQGIVDCQRNILRSLRTGRLAETSAGEQLKTTRVLFAAIESTLHDKVVVLTEGYQSPIRPGDAS